ncbi:MAG: sigma-70 family RNA polymerase sigma factor [Pseudomonadales bacterium]
MKESIHDLKSRRGAQDALDLELLQHVATKDKIAFETLYSRYYSQLSRYLTRLVRRPELVEEIINDTMFVVWEKAAGFEGRSKVSTWVTGIAYLKGIKALDRLKTMPEQRAENLAEVDDIEENINIINKLGLEDWLESGLELISEDQRSVVELTYFSGYSYQEIADIMDCPVNTVKTRMFHARRRLAKLLPRLQEQNKAGSRTDSETEGH